MSGHSHWAGIKHKKALVDNKRGKLWSKLSKAIIIAAKAGGGDPSMNLKLRYAIDEAKAVSMPKDNITRAIKRGTGELDGGNLEELLYEGYGAGGVAVIAEVLTDNRNRTAPEIRKVFEVGGGKLGTSNCVSWMFDRKGLFHLPISQIAEDPLMELMMEAGADDCNKLEEEEVYEILCSPDMFGAIMEAFEANNLHPTHSQMTRIPQNTVDLTIDDARRVMRLMDRLDDQDDVQNVYSNFSIPDDVRAQLEEEDED